MQLTLKGIQKKQDWNAANIALPSYSIEEIRKKTREKPVWVHFGAGNICLLYTSDAADEYLFV